jgi:quinol monooxygenase YgiN
MTEQTPSIGNVHLIVELTAQDGKQAELGERIATLAHATRRDDGAIRFDVVQDATDKNVFRLIAYWRDSAALTAHQATAHLAAFSEAAPALLAKPYTMVTGTLLAE